MFKKAAAKLGLIAASTMAAVGTAFAAVPTEVTTQLTESKADVATVGGAVLAVIIVVVGYKLIKRAM